MEEHKIEFIFIPPVFGKKNQLCTTNTISRWYRFAKTKIKQEFKEQLEGWFLPLWEDTPYLQAEIEYTILRKDGKNIDSDSFSVSCFKWLRDILAENNYLVDDNLVRQIMNPTRLHVEGSVETSVHVIITLKQRFHMEVNDLKRLVSNLSEDLAKVDMEDGEHSKAASARVRKTLGEIKNAVPQLRRDLIALDKG